MTDTLRAKLESASQSSRRPVSEEIEFRLEQSFLDNAFMSIMGDGGRSAALLSMISSVISVANKNGQKWSESPLVCNIVAKSVHELVLAGFPDSTAIFENMKSAKSRRYRRQIDDAAQNIAASIASAYIAASNVNYDDVYADDTTESFISEVESATPDPIEKSAPLLKSMMLQWGRDQSETDEERAKKLEGFIEQMEKLTGRKMKRVAGGFFEEDD